MDLWHFLNYYLDGNITCQIYDVTLSDHESILFEGSIYNAIKALRTAGPVYDIEQFIEVDERGVMYIPVEKVY